MGKCCEKWFPYDKAKGISSYKGQRSPGFYMNDALKEAIYLWVKNLERDWDVVLVISGGGGVRCGKSNLAQSIACYWSYAVLERYGVEVPFTIEDNIVFNGADLIKKGNKLGRKHKMGVMLFDEAGADLVGKKAMKKSTQAVHDYLLECGQYRALTLLCIPEYFDLSKNVATNRSNALLDCYVTVDKDDYWVRGQFNFYSKPQKKKLYLFGKKTGDYSAAKSDFHGRWNEFKGLDKEEYEKKKLEALLSREETNPRDELRWNYLKGALKILLTDYGLTQSKVAERIGEKQGIKTNHRFIGRLLEGKDIEKEEEEEDNTE